MIAAYYVIAATLLFCVSHGVTNQNKYSAHAIVSGTNNLNLNIKDDPTLGSEGHIRFEEANRTKHPVKFAENGPVSNHIEIPDDLHHQDTKVLFQDNERPSGLGANIKTNQIDTEDTRIKLPLRFIESSSHLGSKLPYNHTVPLRFTDDYYEQGSTSETKPVTDNVGPIKFVNDVARFPEVNVIPGGATQLVFKKDQTQGMSNSQGVQHQQTQDQQQKKRRRRRKRLYRRRIPLVQAVVDEENRPLRVMQDTMKMIVENDKKKCIVRMFCEQAHELTTQPHDTVNNLRTAISSIADFFKILPSLKEKIGMQVGNLTEAMTAFADAGFIGQTKGVAACREAYPECPSDPIEMANYLLSFHGGFTHFFNGENYTGHNIFTLNKELGFEPIKTGDEHGIISSNTYNEEVHKQAALGNQQEQLNYQAYQQNYPAYQQNYQPYYQQNYQQPYTQMSYGLQQNYQPNFQHSNQLQYQQNYPPY